MVIDGVPDQAKPTGFHLADGRSGSPCRKSKSPEASTVLPASSEAGRVSRQSGRRSGKLGTNGRGAQTDCPSEKSRRVEIPSGSDKLVIEYRPEAVNSGAGVNASCDIARRLSSGHGFNQNAPDQFAFIFDPQTKNASQGLADIGVAHGCLVAKTCLEVRTVAAMKFIVSARLKLPCIPCPC